MRTKKDLRNWSRIVLCFGLPLLTVALLAFAVGLPVAKADGNSEPAVVPPNDSVDGKAYAEWSACWWQWALGIPADENPLLDEKGKFANENQSGPVWFLAGNFGGETVRKVTVPTGKKLFFPVFNYVWVTFPEDIDSFDAGEYMGWTTGWADCVSQDYECIRAVVRPAVDDATVTCEIDGVAVDNLSAYRFESSVFDLELLEGNLLGLDPGSWGPCVDDGYYLMLEPLSAGHHVIHFTAVAWGGGFSLDVTYELKVKDKEKAED